MIVLGLNPVRHGSLSVCDAGQLSGVEHRDFAAVFEVLAGEGSARGHPLGEVTTPATGRGCEPDAVVVLHVGGSLLILGLPVPDGYEAAFDCAGVGVEEGLDLGAGPLLLVGHGYLPCLMEII